MMPLTDHEQTGRDTNATLNTRSAEIQGKLSQITVYNTKAAEPESGGRRDDLNAFLKLHFRRNGRIVHAADGRWKQPAAT